MDDTWQRKCKRTSSLRISIKAIPIASVEIRKRGFLFVSIAKRQNKQHKGVEMEKRVIAIVTAVIGVTMSLIAAGKTDDEIRQEKEALFWASLSQSERAYHESLNANTKPRMKAARLMAAANATASEPSITVTEVKQREGTYGVGAIVDVTYNLANTERQCKVEAKMTNNGVEVASPSIDQDGDIGGGVQPGEGKHFVWNVGKDWPSQHSDKFKVTLTATEMDVPSSWTTVTISWQAYTGGRDVDICAFWADKPGEKVGWSWISNSSSGYNALKWPTGDNTGTGPEQVYCDAVPQVVKKLYIHFNYYGEVGSAAKVDVTVKNQNSEPLTKTSAAGTNRRNKATMSDPGIVITFDENGAPISID